MSKAYVLGLAMGLALLAVIGVGASRRQRDVQRDAKEEKARAELAQYNEDIVDATEVQLGVLTATQRIHSRFYTYYKEVRGKSITNIAGSVKGKNKIVETMVMPGLGPHLSEPETPKNFFAKLAHESDAIISGRVASKVSQITEDDYFVFTDYRIIVAEVLKNNIATPVEPGATITVTRPGGKVVLDGVIVKAKDASFAPLPLNNDVLLFLRYISETGSYRVTTMTGAFELLDGLSFHPLTTASLFPPGVLEDRTSLLQTVRAVSKDR